ncbi:hypothetical protein ESA94_01235 [Lacibacter luteus]|uniref:Copper resistance protein NlpE n=1 Tax=Lacibacter luteus TaxID=2508719 RepID=A0A4Q1CM36_9BACT|nr:copper resistance protein NlpE N-terminal domain-containing protein [Lacibacter luteus]RXK61669.1 hypothetical protein ESA94_01235 [Lacibacter luteus]
MKPIQSAFTLMTLVACLSVGKLQRNLNDSSILGIFAGTTPCGQFIRPLHKVSAEADCAMVQWKLILYRDPVSRKPTTYKLSSVNRFIVKGTNMYSEPGTKMETEGKWTIVQGTKTNPNAVTYQLGSDKTERSIRFLKLSDNLIHLLDSDGKLMIGNESFSYTLNRVAN